MAAILVVDDEQTVREFIGALLQDEGHHVLLVADGHEALSALRVVDVDLILCDLMMPLMNGVTLVTHLRASPATATVPIILMSAGRGKPTLPRNTYMVFLEKPFLFHDLLRAVELALATIRDA